MSPIGWPSVVVSLISQKTFVTFRPRRSKHTMLWPWESDAPTHLSNKSSLSAYHLSPFWFSHPRSQLARRGLNVVLISRTLKKLQAAATEIGEWPPWIRETFVEPTKQVCFVLPGGAPSAFLRLAVPGAWGIDPSVGSSLDKVKCRT